MKRRRNPRRKSSDRTLTKSQRLILAIAVFLAIIGILWWQYWHLGEAIKRFPAH